MGRLIQLFLFCICLSGCVPVPVSINPTNELGTLFDKTEFVENNAVLLLRVGFTKTTKKYRTAIVEAARYGKNEVRELLSRRDRWSGVAITFTPVVRSSGTTGYLLINSKGESLLLLDCFSSDCSVRRFAETNEEWVDNLKKQSLSDGNLRGQFGNRIQLKLALNKKSKKIATEFLESITFSEHNEQINWEDI